MTQRIRVNGTEASFNDQTITLLNGEGFNFGITEGCEELNWSDEVDVGSFQGQSPYEEDDSTGDYSGSGSMVYKTTTWLKIQKKMGPLGGPFGCKFNVVTHYTDKEGVSHRCLITKCRFVKRNQEGKRGKEILRRTVDFRIGGKVYEDGRGPFGEAEGT